MTYAYKFRLYPNKAQEELIKRTFGCVRFVYNHYLAQRIEQYQSTGTTSNYYEQIKNLTTLKCDPKTSWLCEVDSRALQNSLRNLDTAYKNFFRGVKDNTYVGYPKFRSKRNKRQSYTTNSCIHVFEDSIRLPKLGKVKCRVSKEVKGCIMNATVSQNPSGKYFVSICCSNVEIEPIGKTSKVCGVDLGVRNLVITSDGVKYNNLKYLSKSEKKLNRLQQQLSRKSKGSKNRDKVRVKLAKVYEHISNQRKDTMHKITTELIKNYDVICIEDLSPTAMLRNHKLAKSIVDASFGEFRRQLEYKALWYGKTISVVDRFYPSSQICSCCGTQWKGMNDLSIRSWTCQTCGAELDRDINAAINIRNEGLRLLA